MFSYEINVLSTLFVLPLWLINRDYQESTLMQRCHAVWVVWSAAGQLAGIG
jgi:hypothetical protein